MLPMGGSVRMFPIAATSGRSDWRLVGRLSARTLCVTALPGITLSDTLARLVLSQRLHHHRVTGECTDNVVAARHKLLAVARIAFEAHTAVVTACREANRSFSSNLGAVRVQFGCFLTLCDFPTPLWVKLCVSELLTSR